MTTSLDEQNVRAAIAFYAEGMRTGDVETLKRGFHEQAILCGYLGDDLIAGPIVELYNWVASNPAPAATGDAFSCETLGIELTGRVATARVRESDHHGVVIDHFHLLKVGERWSSSASSGTPSRSGRPDHVRTGYPIPRQSGGITS